MRTLSYNSVQNRMVSRKGSNRLMHFLLAKNDPLRDPAPRDKVLTACDKIVPRFGSYVTEKLEHVTCPRCLEELKIKS